MPYDWPVVVMFLGISASIAVPVNTLCKDFGDRKKAASELKMLEAQSAIDDCDLADRQVALERKYMELEKRIAIGEQNNLSIQKSVDKVEITLNEQTSSLKRDFQNLESKIDVQHNQVMQHLLKLKGDR